MERFYLQTLSGQEAPLLQGVQEGSWGRLVKDGPPVLLVAHPSTKALVSRAERGGQLSETNDELCSGSVAGPTISRRPFTIDTTGAIR